MGSNDSRETSERDLDLLSAYLDGELDRPDDRDRVADRLRTDDEYSSRLRDFRWLGRVSRGALRGEPSRRGSGTRLIRAGRL